jgi:hypothetical protein
MDLITNARARFNIPSATSGDDHTINTLIAAASEAIERYCRRRFAPISHDELYHGSGESRLLLRHFPILSVQSVRYRPAAVLRIINNDSSVNQQARVAVTATGLSLIRTASGVTSTQTVTFAANATLASLAAAINGLGNGWSGQAVAGYEIWPSADLRSPQGALPALAQHAELKVHTVELGGFAIDQQRGWLVRSGAADPELASQNDDPVWPIGIDNFRVQYTAGYAAIPEDVQEACAELVATWFVQRGRDLSLRSEETAGNYRYEVENSDHLPRRIQALLKPHRNHRIAL